MPGVCKFWLQGYCRNGDSCRFEHPSNRNQPNNRGQNRFAPLDNDRSGQGGRGANQRRDAELPYNLDAEAIRADLSKEPPQWILSCYGPGKNAPAQLFGGLPREQSFEEMRLRHYELAARGQQQQAVDEAQKLVGVAAEQIRVALQDVNGAMDFICSAEKDHPNRIDICKSGTTGNNSGGSGFANVPGAQGFGKPSGTSFGQPSQPSSGRGAFAKGLAPSAGGFGQPSNPSTGGFGQPPAPSIGGFGRPSAQPAGGFGQPSAPSAGGFGQPSAAPKGGFGQLSGGGFGQPSTGGFGQPPAIGLGQPSAGGFGQPSTGGFGQPSAGGLGQQPTGGFGQPSTGGFGQSQTSASGEFGQSSAPAGGSFGQSTSSPFANTAQQTPNPFAKAQGSFAQPSQPAHSAPIGQTVSQRDATGKLSSWQGMPVSYPGKGNEPCFRRPDGKWERIWFPDGEPDRTMPQDIPLENYNDELEEQYRYLKQNGEFKDGVVPPLPPKWEWTSWDI